MAPAAPAVTDLELLDTIVETLTETLGEAVMDDPAQPASERLARIAVGLLRALVPLLERERDRMRAELAPPSSETTRR